MTSPAQSPVSKPLVSIVVPAYNEEPSLAALHAELLANLDTERYDYEIVLVNDGSADGTWLAIENLARQDPHVRGINFSRNFGHHAALEAGLMAARGDAVIMMDADLQHPPEVIGQLLAAWEDGYDIVNTERLSTEGVGLVKRLTSRLFYKVLNAASGLKLKNGEADFRLASRQVMDQLNALPETPKFYRGLFNWIGFRQTSIPYQARARQHGTSSYSIKKMIELARLGMTSFSRTPLKFIIAVGLALTSLSALMLIAMMVVKLWVNAEFFSNNAILVMFLIFVTGLLTTFQGIVAIYLVDIFDASKGRPTFVVRDTIDPAQLTRPDPTDGPTGPN